MNAMRVPSGESRIWLTPAAVWKSWWPAGYSIRHMPSLLRRIASCCRRGSIGFEGAVHQLAGGAAHRRNARQRAGAMERREPLRAEQERQLAGRRDGEQVGVAQPQRSGFRVADVRPEDLHRLAFPRAP